MKKKGYILVMTAIVAAALLTGCNDKKQDNQGNNTENAANVSADVLDFDASEYVKLGDYKGLEVTYPSVLAVTDEEVQENIQYELEENTDYKEVTDRATETGDIVNIDYKGTIDGEEFEGGTDSGYELELGSGDFLEDFENSLTGKKAGETVTFKLTFPEEYDPGVAGKEAEFTVKINSISVAVTPEYNEEYVKSISDYETIEEYEASVKKQLQEEAEDASKMEAEENALRLAIENATVEGYPQKLYDFFYDDTVTGYKNYAEFMGIDYEEFLESYMSEDDIKEVTTDQVNEFLVASAILKAEGQEVGDSDYAKLAEEMAKENEYETLEEYEGDYGKTYVMTQIVRQKAIDILYDAAKLQEVPYDEYYADDELESDDMESEEESEVELEDEAESDSGDDVELNLGDDAELDLEDDAGVDMREDSELNSGDESSLIFDEN